MGDNKRIWIPTKLVNSIYWQDVCNLVAAGKEPAEIHKFLNEEKEYKISLPAVRGAVNYIKVHGQSALQVAKVSKSIGGDVQGIKYFFFKVLYYRAFNHFKVCILRPLVTY
jgi:hypothetical protein